MGLLACLLIKCLLSRPGLIAGPFHSTPLQINSQSIPRLDPINSKSSLEYYELWNSVNTEGKSFLYQIGWIGGTNYIYWYKFLNIFYYFIIFVSSWARLILTLWQPKKQPKYFYCPQIVLYYFVLYYFLDKVSSSRIL